MAKVQNPIFKSKIECPVCKHVNEFEVIKQGAYTESGRDTDFMPVGREWNNPAYQKFNPLLFFAAACSQCYYTRELNSAYKDWQNDTNFKSYKLPSQAKKHLNELKTEGNILTEFGEKINTELFPFESAVIKMLLAIYDERYLDHPSALDLARYYLRIAWLYREQNQDGESAKDPAEMLLSSLQIEIDKLITNAGIIETQIPPLRERIVNDFDVVINSNNNQAITSKMKTAIGKVQEVCGCLTDDIKALQAELSNVTKEINLAKRETSSSGEFQGFGNFSEFLYSVKDKWSEIPVNETEALSLSLSYYMKAYQNPREIKAGLQQLQAAYLIAELSRRINNYELALEYFKTSNKMAQDLMAKNRNDRSLVANAQKIFEISLEQGRLVKVKEPAKV